MRLLVLILLLSGSCFGQELKWAVPEGAGTDFIVQGYKILYEIEPTGICGDYSKTRPRYALDVGLVYKYDIGTDVNFQPGFSYFIAIVTYTITEVRVNNELRAHTVMESLISNSRCIKIKGIPARILLDENGQEIINQGRENEESDFDFGDIDKPISESGGSKVRVDARYEGRPGGSNSTEQVYTKMGAGGWSDRSGDFNWSAIADTYFDRRGNRDNNVDTKHVKTRMASRSKVLFSNDGHERGIRGVSSKLSTSLQNNSSETKLSKIKRAINIKWGLIVSAIGLLGMIRIV